MHARTHTPIPPCNACFQQHSQTNSPGLLSPAHYPWEPHTCTHGNTSSNRESSSVKACSWSKLQFIQIVNIPCRHLKSPSQIQGAYYTPLPPNHTTHRDFHQLGCILYQAARYFNHPHHTTCQSPGKLQGSTVRVFVCVRQM